jgi:hypothetical protein
VIDGKMQQVRIRVDQLGPVDAVRLQIIIQYFDDIIRGFANKEHLAPLISRMGEKMEVEWTEMLTLQRTIPEKALAVGKCKNRA